MSNRNGGNAGRVLRTATWLYVTPRIVIVGLILGAVALAAFLILVPLTGTVLQRLGH